MEVGNRGELYHLGRGINYSINELASMFKNAKIKYVPVRKGEGLVTLADYEETFTQLSWRATHDLKDYIYTQTK